MADEEYVSRPATMDLNLYLGLPRSPRPRSLDLGSDLSLSSLPLPASSDSGESRAPEATSGAMEASASHSPDSPPRIFLREDDVPSAGPWQQVLENPYFLDYEPYMPACAQQTEGPSAPYSPSNAQVLPEEQIVVESAERDEERHASFDEILGLHLVDDSSLHGEGSQTPYSPSYHPPSPANQDEENFGTFRSLPLQSASEFSFRVDGSSSQHDPLQSPEFRIRRLIESHGLRQRSLRQSLYEDERMNFAPPASPSPEQLVLEIMGSQRSLQINGKQKAPADILSAESSEKDAEEKNRCATNFDCNICFDIAKEPVVTSCGHLFCWPCLYQWIYVHSEHKECPVCKGEVTEVNITPIYGRGSPGSDMENKDDESRVSGLSIPPRPCGNRLESWRQHFYPFSRRIGEGIANSWRRFLNYQLRSRSRLRGHEDTLMQEVLSGGTPSILTRSMTRRLQREQGITENGPSTEERRLLRHGGLLPRDGGIGLIHDEIDTAHGLHSLAAMNFEIGRAVGRFTENANRYGVSSSVNAPSPDQFVSVGGRPIADQASASSTVAVISGESSARDASTEPNSAGSSRPCRRIGGSSASCSSDDGGNLHTRKRRRLH